MAKEGKHKLAVEIGVRTLAEAVQFFDQHEA